MIGANAIESFAKSSFGLAVLKNVFGAKEEFLSGLLGEAATNQTPVNETKSTASVITNSEPLQEEKQPLTENEKIRNGIKKSINDFLDKLNDGVLRNYFELVQLLGSDTETIQSILLQIKAYREKQKAFIEQKMKASTQKNEGSENAEGQNENDESEEEDDTS